MLFLGIISAYTNPKTLTAGILTLNDRHGAFESFCAPVFCDFIRNYFLSDSETVGFLDTSLQVKCIYNLILWLCLILWSV